MAATASSGPLVLSVDGFGGDNAPGAIVEGMALFSQRRPDVRFVLHGRQVELAALLQAHPALAARTEIADAPDVVGMDTKPSAAMRQAKTTSMGHAIAAVREGRSQAAVSAGNTGALMAIAKLGLRLEDGVHRPAMAAAWPTAKGVSTVLDVGANIDADASQLVEFAIMGEAFHRAIHGTARPSVRLLNIGSEDMKGHEEIREAAKLLRETPLGLNYEGFIEGDGIGAGEADVVVCDGFTGNIALKTAEGTAKFVSGMIKRALTAGPLSMMGAMLASGGLKSLKTRMDPRVVNGAPFLGLKGLVIKSHGGTDGFGFASALEVAAKLAASPFRAEVGRALAALSAAQAAQTAAAPTPESDVA
jgi:phosphate acyltransferase